MIKETHGVQAQQMYQGYGVEIQTAEIQPKVTFLSVLEGEDDSQKKKSLRLVSLTSTIALSIILPTMLTAAVQHPFYLPLVVVSVGLGFSLTAMYANAVRRHSVDFFGAAFLSTITTISIAIFSASPLYRLNPVNTLTGLAYILSFVPAIVYHPVLTYSEESRFRDIFLGVGCMK